MSPYRFSWNAFDDNTVQALAQTLGFQPNATSSNPRSWLTEKVKRPNDDFVRQTKRTLEQCWLPQYPGVKSIVDYLIDADIGPIGNPNSQNEYVNYIRRCRNTRTVRQRILEALLRFGDRDSSLDGVGELPGVLVPRFTILQPSKQQIDNRQPHEYQKEAWNKLSAHLAEAESSHVFQGLLVMPTGSGKTFTAVWWLIQNVVNRGERVLWLAHRHELLEQAAKEFYALSQLATKCERLRIRIVSGIHCSTTQIDPADNILICSVSSLARRPDLSNQILSVPHTFLVIDEAHHSPAKSYRDIINRLGTDKSKRILGLTATPTRTIEQERGTLSSLFGNRIIYEALIKDLIERKFLARPIPVRVTTDASVEDGVTQKDEQHLAQFNDLSEEWLDRIANIEERNDQIVNHYLKNRDKYGKTLIFAINVLHAALLTERLNAQLATKQHQENEFKKAEYVASYRPDGELKDNREIIKSFRDDSQIDVLVNVQILTEGVDFPKLKTVFLTRPTVSEILVRQMIGRALRGKEAGGTESAYIVSFEDHWERFREWQSPLALIPDILVVEPEEPPSITPNEKELLEILPWDIILDIRARLQGKGFEADVFEAIPNGWFVLSRTSDGEDVYQVICVYEHQRPSWEAFIEYLEQFKGELQSLIVSEQFDEFFDDCDFPWPSQHELQKMLEHFRAGGSYPEYNEIGERQECDPYLIANHIWQEDVGARAQPELLKSRYTKLAKAIYPTLREFQSAVDNALYEIQHPRDTNRFRRAVPIFHPRSDERLTPGPHHNLERLMESVLAMAPRILGLDNFPPHEGKVEWTRRLVKGWYGQASWEPGQPSGQGRIRINRLLDSPDISESVLQFLLWHEYLHLYLLQGHTRTFREFERKWSGYVEAEQVLDNLNERFGIQYW